MSYCELNQNEKEKPTQIQVTPFVESKVKEWGITNIKTTDNLENLGQKLHEYLQKKPVNEKTQEDEKEIRWKRTGSQILEDGYVYKGKACTDVVIAFMTLAKAAGIKDTRFVKLLKIKDSNKIVHSVGEFKLDKVWYTYDIANKNAKPILGEITEYFGDYSIWKKGKDSWDLELDNFKSISKINFTN